MINTALVIAAHPDDEVLGCGATIARLADEGWLVHILIVAEGATSRSQTREPAAHGEELSQLARCAQEAGAILGANSVTTCALPDNRLDSIDLLDIVKLVESHIQQHRPKLVFSHHAGDVNIDHRRLHDAVIAATRPQPGMPVTELLFFEVQSSTEWRPPASGPVFAPNCYYDISKWLNKKLCALKAYSPEMREFPHSRSLEAVEYLAKWRGASVGCQAAEAFVLGRRIV